ncbi:MAG: complex I NDUFA9 subunit family protein [Pseudomonadota bacterium]|nr:complex I NDUFA9 subunit family protein [Pseudomonadota bacterium]
MTEQKNVLVVGGSGFVGGHLLACLTASGYRVSALARSADAQSRLQSISGVQVVTADPDDDSALAECLAGQSVLINLVGILHESRQARFDQVHVDLPRRLIQLCEVAGVSQYLHMSALHADAKAGASRYLRSRGAGEDVAHQSSDQMMVTSFRPSIIFGRNDNFFGVFSNLLRWMPIFPLACPGALFAPVYVGDVVAAFDHVIKNGPQFDDRRLNLCGPSTYTLKQLVQFTARASGRSRLVLGLPDLLSRLQAQVMQRLPGKLFTRDNYLSMQIDSVCAGDDFALLGIDRHTLEDIVTPLLAPRE